MSGGQGSFFDQDIKVERAHDLINLFLKRDGAFYPEGLLDVTEITVNDYIFRGQAKASWPLLPAAHRGPEALRKFIPQMPADYSGLFGPGEESREYLKLHMHAEMRAIQLFHEAADRAGVNTSFDYQTSERHQYLFEKEGKDIGFDQFPIPEYLHIMALAQHHGIPTRLLDWSLSPLIAAFFAAKGALSEAKGELCVLAISTDLIKDVEGVELVRVPYGGNSYLRSQRGVFTLTRCANSHFLEHKKWPSLEDVVGKRRSRGRHYCRPPLVRVRLPVAEAGELLKILYLMNISPATLMPSLASAAREFEYKASLWGSSD